MIFGKITGHLEEQMGTAVVVTLCLGVVLTFSLHSCDKSQSSLADETPRDV